MKNGFSLIELMIAVTIVGILAGIAYPSYSNYTKKSNRTDATRTMFQDAQALERCYSQTFTYVGCATVAATAPSAQGYYTVTLSNVATSTYLLTAIPVKTPQTNDTQCTQFTLTQAGTQNATGSGTTPTQTCWGST